MFKIGKKKEGSDPTLKDRLSPRTGVLSDEDDGSPDSPEGRISRRGSVQVERASMDSIRSGSGGEKRPRGASFLDRVRSRPIVPPDNMSPRSRQDGFLTVHGPTGAIGDGTLMLDRGELSGTPDDRRLSVLSSSSSSSAGIQRPRAPTLVVQNSSPDDTGMLKPINTAGPTYLNGQQMASPIGFTAEELEASRGRENTLTPRPPVIAVASESVPTTPTIEAPDGISALAAANNSPDRFATPTPTSPSLVPVRPTSYSRSPSQDRSPTMPTRRLAGSSFDSPVSPSSAAMVQTGSVKRSKSRAGSTTSNGIAGALALSGVALASPHPGLAQPRVLRSTIAPSLSASLSGQNGVARRSSSVVGHDDAPSREPSDSGHDGVYYAEDGTNSSDVHPSEYDVMMSMESLGNFDDVIEQLGTGYAVASSKRNADFHAIFDTIPDDDYLIEDYGCALQKDILVQGRLYVSEHHLCFNSNIFGWVTSLVIPFSDVMTIEKRMTALIIPNAIQVATMHHRHNFASFLSRDSTYDLITNIWRISHPNVPAAVALPNEGVSINPDVVEAVEAKEEAAAAAAGDDKKAKSKSPKRKKTKAGTVVFEPAEPLGGPAGTHDGQVMTTTTNDPATAPHKHVKVEHPATKCACETNDEHFKNVAMDTTFPTTPEKIYNLMYQSGLMKKFWSESQKLTELNFGEWAPGPSGAQLLKRTGSYIMPLTAPMGPKSTKCLITDEHRHVDFDNYITNITTTQTPDVPSGGNFSTVTRTCITWAPKNSCRVLVTTQVEWTKVNRFIRSIVESSAVSGQTRYHAALDTAIREYIKEHWTEFSDDAPCDPSLADTPSEAGAPPIAAGPATPGLSPEPPRTKAPSRPEQKESPLDQIISGLSDALGGIVEMATEQSPMMLGAAGLAAVLLLFNLWTLFFRRSGAGGATSTAAAAGHEVAIAVRDVLEHYFAHGGPYHRTGPSVSTGARGSLSPHAEVEEILKVLDGVEARIAAVRSALGSAATQVAAAAGAATSS